MATARKLSSGSWNCKVYSHTEKVKLPDGTTKDKRIYKSFTCDIPGPQGKRACEKMAADWAEMKEEELKKKKQNVNDMTLTEAIGKYIQSRERLNRSPTTVQEYKCTAKFGFAGIIDMKIADLDETTLQAAIDLESQRKPLKKGKNGDNPISAKRLRNEWGLIAAVLKKYRPGFYYSVELPAVTQRVPDLLPAKTVFEVVKGTDIELAVLLAAWLSFSLSEIRGLTKSKSISGNYIRIAEVVVDVGGEAVRKDMAKNPARNRTHRIPKYIKELIDKTEGDVLVPFDGWEIYKKWTRLLKENHLPHMTFHDLRHLNASVMALLHVPDKYAQERGGWKTGTVMKRVYTQTFPDERVKVDDMIDEYFEGVMQHENEKSP